MSTLRYGLVWLAVAGCPRSAPGGAAARAPHRALPATGDPAQAERQTRPSTADRRQDTGQGPLASGAAADGQDVPFEGTVGSVAQPRDGQAPSVLVALRAARHQGFDRVVFVFEGQVPGYHVEYVDRPVRQCGSGEAVALLGDGWLEVRMAPAYAHDEQGRALAGPRERLLRLGALRELALTCDFEAVVTWVLGLSAPNPYRVRELSSPPRLVIDVEHMLR